MTVHQVEISIHTAGHRDMQDITQKVSQIVNETEISTGLVNIFNIGSTAIIGTIEYEPGLQKDLPDMLDKIFPPDRDYGHEQAWHDGNGHSHLQATTLGPDITIPLKNHEMVLGTWQQIFHLECDVRPRDRRIMVTVIGE